MTSHHTIYDITCTVFMASLPLYLKWHPPFLCHHNVSIDGLRPTVYMTSHPHYVWHLMHSTQHLIHSMFSHHCSYHITYIAFMTSHQLHMTSHTIYLWHHIHSNYDTSPTRFVTLNSVYKTSHMINEWQHNKCIWHDTQCICVIKPTWLMTSQPMYEWNHTHCMYDNIGTLYDITSTVFFSFFYLWWILSYIEMKQPWLYMCSPSQSPLPPLPSPVSSRFSQCTSSERLSHASNLGWWSVSH